MGVTRRNDRQSWIAKSSFKVNGKRPQQNFNDKKHGGRKNAERLAHEWLTQIDADILRGHFIDPHRNKIPLEEFKEQVGIVKLNQSENTKAILENVWEYYIATNQWFVTKAIGSITSQDIARLIKNLKKEDGSSYSHSTIKKVEEVLRVLFRKAVEMDYILKNPVTTSVVSDWIPKEEQSKNIYLDKFQVNAIFKDFQEHSPQYAVAIPLLAYTGLRSGELRGLYWSDIDFDKASLKVSRQFNDATSKFSELKTTTSQRTIKLPQYVLNYLKQHKKEYKTADCELVFPDKNCKNAILGKNFKNRHLKPALQRLDMDMKINLHTFRHTSVRLARESGADLQAISKRLGHKKISMTADKYSELFENIDTELVERLDEYIAELG
ncbi:site-specific integrase [Acidimicrobiaceae bacterium]|jgi:integrase|nr:site-specific integrase [Acidimicrobiaceae bacterium]|tara:strand:+ start:368 stop:1510 length:1143 start_codon:yes stop_codon:yes gene_type:complete